MDYYFNKREGEGGGKSTYLDYYFNKREDGGGLRVHNWIITLISGRGEKGAGIRVHIWHYYFNKRGGGG